MVQVLPDRFRKVMPLNSVPAAPCPSASSADNCEVAHELPPGAAPDDTGLGADELGGSVVGGVLGWIGLPLAVGTAGDPPRGSAARPPPPPRRRRSAPMRRARARRELVAGARAAGTPLIT